MKKITVFLPKFLYGALFLMIFQAKSQEITNNEVSQPEVQHFWSGQGAQYLFAPGILCSEYIVGKYCSQYKASTGESVYCSQALELVNGAATVSCNFAEIVLSTTKSAGHKIGILRNKLNDLAEGFQTWRFQKPYKIIVQGESHNGLTLKPYLINPFQFNIGQDLDIDIYSKQYDQCCSKNEQKEIVLYGTSRGAATVFNFIATEYKNKSDKRVKAIVLEGCFDAVRNVTTFETLIRLLPRYKRYGKAPIDLVDDFVTVCNENGIAVLAVTSEIDTIVPYKNTMRLCDALLEKGLKDFYVLKLENSGHRDYTCDNGEDMQRYQKVVHAFYKKFNLPHNPMLAFAGQQELELCVFDSNRIIK